MYSSRETLEFADTDPILIANFKYIRFSKILNDFRNKLDLKTYLVAFVVIIVLLLFGFSIFFIWPDKNNYSLTLESLTTIKNFNSEDYYSALYETSTTITDLDKGSVTSEMATIGTNLVRDTVTLERSTTITNLAKDNVTSERSTTITNLGNDSVTSGRKTTITNLAKDRVTSERSTTITNLGNDSVTSGRKTTITNLDNYDYNVTPIRLSTISNENINEMNYCLGDILIIPKDFDSSNGKRCQNENYQIKAKYKIRFVMEFSTFFDCLIRCSDVDDYRFERQKHMLLDAFKDIYYNYMMGRPDHVYEGRRLSCSFDEKFLPDNHESILVIGIPTCESSGFSAGFDVENFHVTLQKFLKCAEKSHLLTKNYTLEFPTLCEDYLFKNRQLTGYEKNIVFLDDSKMDFDKYFDNVYL